MRINEASKSLMISHDSLDFRFWGESFQKIHFAGTECSLAYRGTMDGAVRSGQKAAKQVSKIIWDHIILIHDFMLIITCVIMSSGYQEHQYQATLKNNSVSCRPAGLDQSTDLPGRIFFVVVVVVVVEENDDILVISCPIFKRVSPLYSE